MTHPDRITLHDLSFEPLLSAEEIRERIEALGEEIAVRHQDHVPLFLAILNGSFIFAADLMRACPISSEVVFTRLNSYRGTSSTGSVSQDLQLAQDIADRHLIVVEDIVDSGFTLSHYLPKLASLQPASVEVATLLHKPTAVEYPVELQYVGFEIPDRFVVGYGLDYNGLGRHLPGIYQLPVA